MNMVGQAKKQEASVNIKETLHDLDQELVLLLDFLQGEDESDRASAEELFQQFLPRLESKIDSYIFALQNLQVKHDYHEQVATSLAKSIKSEEKAIAWLKSKLQAFMENRVEQMGVSGKRLEGKITKVALCGSGGTEKLWYDPEFDIEQFPAEVVDYVPQLNKERLRALTLESGGELYSAQGQLIAKIMPRKSHLRF
jgi:hypothetical protein